MLNYGQVTKEYNYQTMKTELITEAIIDLKSLERRLPVSIPVKNDICRKLGLKFSACL